MAIKDVLPKTIWVIDVPERPADLAKRYHNKYAKESLRETVDKWHGHHEGFRKHFRRDARERYNHFPRSEKYKRAKARGVKVDGRKYYSTTDLIKTGRTREQMLGKNKITVGGTAEGKNLRATLTLRFPFKGGTGRFRSLAVPKNLAQMIKQNKITTAVIHQALTIQKMRIELERFDEEDPRLLAQWFLELYMDKVRNHRGGRKRVRISRGMAAAA